MSTKITANITEQFDYLKLLALGVTSNYNESGLFVPVIKYVYLTLPNTIEIANQFELKNQPGEATPAAAVTIARQILDGDTAPSIGKVLVDHMLADFNSG
jgi:hypothetical protein